MAYSEAQKRASQKYNNKAYDQIAIRIPKGKRDEWNEHAKATNRSLAQMIVDSVENDIKKGGS